MINCIAAVDENFGIGYNGQLLEYIPEDMQYFKALTTGHTVIMGRKTWESLPRKPLSNRKNIVITRREIEGAAAASITEAINYILNNGNKEEIFIIGGASIYEQLLPYCDNLWLTHIYKEHDKIDAYFPTLDLSWKVYAESNIHVHNSTLYQFKNYRRF